MDINQSGLPGYKTTKSDPIKTQKNISASTKSITEQREVAPLELKEGQIIKGRIIDHRYDNVTLQLDPGKQILTAKLSGDIPLSIGTDASFQVTEDSSRKISLKYLPADQKSPAESTIDKALLASNFPKTDRNQAIVGELLHYRMPIDKQTLQTLIRASYLNHDASAQSLVLLYKNNIPLTAVNIAQFESYQQGTHQMLNQIRNLLQGSRVLLSPETSDPQSDVDFHQNLIRIVLHNSGKEETVKAPISQTKQTPPLQQIPEREELSQVETALRQYSAGEESTLNQIGENPLLSVPMQKQPLIFTEDTVFENRELQQISPPSLLQGEQDTELPSGDPIFTYGNNDRTDLKSLLSPQEHTSLMELLQNFKDAPESKSAFTDNTITLFRVLELVQKELPNMNHSKAKALLRSPLYQKLIEEALLQKWTISPEKLSKDQDSVPQLYQNLSDDLKKLNELLTSHQESIRTSDFQDSVKSLQDNLQFMKDLNQFYTYVQLPVQFRNQDIHTDLYVFTKKKSLKERAEGISVLLHLDMTHLGAVNILIQLNHPVIQAKFYLEDEAAVTLIVKHLSSLETALEKKGYSMQAEVKSTYRKPDFAKDFIDQSDDGPAVSRYTFDIRT